MSKRQNLGATAIGLFLLGNDYLDSARAASLVRLSNPGPVRLLSLHACELFLKAYLRQTGSTHAEMRKLGHNLSLHAQLAVGAGLPLSNARQNDMRTVTDIKAYVGSRYHAGSPEGPFSTSRSALNLATDVRETVRLALNLNDLGMPEAN